MSFDDYIVPNKKVQRRVAGKRTKVSRRAGGQSKNSGRFTGTPNYKKLRSDDPMRFHPRPPRKVFSAPSVPKTVELNERAVLPTDELRRIATTLLNEDRTEIKFPEVVKVLHNHNKPMCRAIFSYIPFHLLQAAQHQIKTQVKSGEDALYISILFEDASNSSLFRRELRCKKFWLTRQIDETTSGPLLAPKIPPLIPMYDKFGYYNSQLTVRGLTYDEDSHLSSPSNKEEILGGEWNSPSITPFLSRFKRNFRAFTNGMFQDVKFKNAFISGGCITTCLELLPDQFWEKMIQIEGVEEAVYDSLPLPREIQEIILTMALSQQENELCKELALYYDEIAPTADVDVFFTGTSRVEAFAALREVYFGITKNLNQQKVKWKVIRSPNSITICAGAPYRNVQLILLVTQDIREALCFSDIDCTAVAFDGVSVWGTERSVRAFNTRWNFVEPANLVSENFQRRVQKYEDRGFGSLFYEICKHQPRCDVVPTKIIAQYIDELQHKTFAPPEKAFALEYYPSLTQAQILYRLDELYRGTERMNRPYIIGKTLEEVTLPQDHVPFDCEGEGAGLDLYPLRWKREDSARRYRFLLPRCYMCKEVRVAITQEETLNRISMLCSSCEAFNAKKRAQTADLSGRVALVTGGRIKIGYECVLSLLRAGALVIVTTRFPYDACERLRKEDDYTEWKDRVHIYGLDFRNLSAVQLFISHVLKSYERLDILINNAAQTIHRPPAYYKNLADAEVAANTRLQDNANAAICYRPVKSLEENPFLLSGSENMDNSKSHENQAVIPMPSHAGTLLPVGMPRISDPLFSSQYTIVPVMPSDYLTEQEQQKYFPSHLVDEHNEPADLRPQNSWTSTIEEIHPVELIEVQLVNSMIPSMFISQFAGLLEKGKKLTESNNPGSGASFVINVSSAEGQFSAIKYGGHHAHTNMAKAALNMLTRTVAESMGVRGIFVNSVDTGWITKMTPGGSQTEHNVDAPLSPADGAARILDPIFGTINSTFPAPFGLLFKDFKPAPW